MDEDTARWVRVEAARRDLSVSAYLGQVVRGSGREEEGYTHAMERFMSREPRPLAPFGAGLPAREDLYDRNRPRATFPLDGFPIPDRPPSPQLRQHLQRCAGRNR